MTAHRACTETILMGREVGDNEVKDARPHAVDVNGGVYLLPDCCQRS